jgi:hypothetical protein
MKMIKTLAATIALTAVALACVAQEEEDAPEMYTYASYFNCSGGSLDVADKVIADDAARMDGLVEDGTIAHWGYLAHHTGGQWQRIFYHQADSIDALLDGAAAIQNAGDDDADDADDGPGFGSVCNRHDDYIWQVENGSGGDTRGKVGFSVYHVCEINSEERADEIVDEHMAPILNKMVEDGDLNSWGWSSHVVGGRFRKLQTMTAPDAKSLMAARGAAISAMYDDDSEAGKEFSEICGPHVDYIWNIVHEK